MPFYFYFSLMIITKDFFFMGNFLFFNARRINDSGGRDWCENKQYIYLYENTYAKKLE